MNSVGLPYYREVLASAWPDILCDVGAPPPKLDPQHLAGMKAADFGLYGRNVRNTRRNQVEDTRVTNRSVNAGLKAPKFLSEKARESAKSPPSTTGEKGEDMASPTAEHEIDSKKSEVPVMSKIAYWF